MEAVGSCELCEPGTLAKTKFLTPEVRFASAFLGHPGHIDSAFRWNVQQHSTLPLFRA
jgi:hypothetical protein